MKQKMIELQGETDESTIVVGKFNSPLPVIDRLSKLKPRKDIAELKTINQLDLSDIYGYN